MCGVFAFPFLSTPPTLCGSAPPNSAARPTVKFAVTSAEVAVNKAQQEATKALGAEEDDGDGSVRSDDGQHELESAAKKARKAGNCVLQVRRKEVVKMTCSD